MDLTDDLRQHLVAEKDKFKQKILENLTELYFLRNDGLMCDYHVWAAKEKYSSLISNTKDEDILNDQKFTQLLNLKFDEPSTTTNTTAATTTITTTTTTTTNKDSPSQSTSPTKVSPLNLPSATTATSTAKSSAQTDNSEHRSDDLKRKRSLSTDTDEAIAATNTTTTLSLKDSAAAAPPPEKKLRDESPIRKDSDVRSIKLDDNRLEVNKEIKLDDPEVIIVDKADQKSALTTQTKNESPTKVIKVVEPIVKATSADTIGTHDKQLTGKDKLETPVTAHIADLKKQGHRSSNSTPDYETRDESKRRISQSSEVGETGLLLKDAIAPSPGKRLREESPDKREIEVRSGKSVDDNNRLESNDEVRSKEPEVINIDEVNQKIVPTQSKDESPTRISKVVEPIVTPSAPSVENHNKQLLDRAKHEAQVTTRIAELRKQGLWSAKKLPKLQDPPRPKTHWDYLLEEMRWLASDFDAERKWKRKAAKRCALMVYKYHQEKRAKEERIEREKLQHIKKLAASQAKEIRSFWSSIEKIVDFRQQTKLEEARNKAMGLHLNYILDQTSKISYKCLEDTNNATKEIGIDYLISQADKNEEKETVINNEEQTKPKHEEVDDIAEGARSIQPKGNTLETATVSTKVPFLLKHTLREYQHIGLDWLVAMYNKKLNGILADEMGLGKTIQTIALLAHLACEKGDWGPHLIVVPTSVMLNWEMEFKKWCPAFKILTYYGNPKERKLKRVGWSRPNSFHICITSYRIVIQDHASFRRKKWCYFILDEAHYIKNFKSQRWQMLLNFNSQRRLLLTGTPLQNDLMELWSLMHFLMPNLFDSYREFKDWFVNPLTGMIEGSHEYNQELVQRLHKILRPFLLRRLKADVEKQLPRKREFIKTCRLSKRQRYLYEEFMSLSKTKETLASGNFLSVINVLMQLRKVCNHPNLFEPRPTISPFLMSSIAYNVPGIVTTPLDYNPKSDINLSTLQLLLVNTGSSMTSLACDYIRSNKIPQNKLLEELNVDENSVTSSQTIEEASVQEVDKSLEAINSEPINEAYSTLKEALLVDKRSRMNFMSSINDARCEKANSLYFSDLKDRLFLSSLDKIISTERANNVFSNGNGRILCSVVQELRDKPVANIEYLTSLLDEAIRSPEQVVKSMSDVIDRFVFCVPGVSAPPISLHVSHYSPSKKMQEVFMQQSLYEDLSPRFNFLNRIVVSMRTSFPELRLIEYDCGKLQTLSRLLNELKSQDHRVLIFTQMSRMLDILEQFLNYHGHTYLRLDGATKIDQRQILMERFNNDRRIFCFILSTRSGGIGVNLTGADTVIFYDSDWNPTMDAQAQDRCHRIGQTRDVHIYRLISEDTIEKNIFMKAQQKRMLGDLAIEEGNFNTSSTKRHTIHELFNVEPSNEPIEVDKVTEVNGRSVEMSKAELNKLEQALSKGEADAGEDMDVDAIKVARADVDTDLREFDESIPITENADDNSQVEKSEKEMQIDTIVNQMTPVERYAVNLLESLQKPKNKEELEQVEMEYRIELENKKSQWEQSRIEMLKEQATTNDDAPTETTMLTYPRGAKCDHVQYLLDGDRNAEEMPLWAPPTPPTSPPSPVEEINQYHYQPAMTPAMAARINAMGGLGSIFGFGSDSNKTDVRHFIDEKDLYIDYTNHFLYEPNIMLESQLPPINQQYTDNEATNYTIGSKKIRLTGTPVVPGGYFQTPTPHLAQHLQKPTSTPSAPDGNSSVIIGQPAARKPKVRRDEVICLPKSIFDRQTPNFAKIRRELKLQKLRCVTKGNDSDPFAMQKFFHTFSLNPLGQSLQQDTIVTNVNKQISTYQNPSILLAYHQDQIPTWTIQEEWALIMVIQHLQDLPVNLCVLTPGHTPNWDFVSEVISDIGFTHRSNKMCEYHFSLTIQKREMTRDSSWDERSLQSNSPSDSSQPPAKKSKKHKNQQPSTDGPSSQQSTSSKSSSTTAVTVPFKPSKTGAMLATDKSFIRCFGERYDAIKRVREKRPKPIRARYTARERQAGAALIRDDSRLIDYERPLKPETVIKELAEERKRRLMARAAAAAQSHMVAQQQQLQVHPQQPIATLPQPISIPRPPSIQSAPHVQPQQPLIQSPQIQPQPPPQQPQTAPPPQAPTQYNPYFYSPSK